MRNIVRFYLSLEKLVKNPVDWFHQRNWLVRYLTLLLLIPPIAVASISSYSSYLQSSSSGVEPIHSETYKELVRLRENFHAANQDQKQEIEKLNHELTALKQSLAKNSTLDDQDELQVLGTKNNLTASESATLEQNLVIPTQIVRLVKNNDQDITVFSSPQTSSQPVTTLSSDTIHFYLDKQNDWYQIDLENDQSGWVEARYVSELP